LTQDVDPKKIGKVPRNAILKPSDAEQRLSNQMFTIGDRVVYVQDSGRVPIGSYGTVIGKTRTARALLLDVVFDATFMSGTSLGDRCSPFRGSTVPATTVLNLTDKQVVSYSSAAAAKRPQQPAQPYTVIGAPGGPQLIPANTPAPLQGSYRGAFGGAQNGARGGGFAPRGRGSSAPRGNAHMQNGAAPPAQQGLQQDLPIRHRGGRGGGSAPRGGAPNGAANQNINPNVRGNSNGAPRGRGGSKANRGGFVSTDMTDPTAGVVQNNPNFQPQNYSSVPPPASLENGGRGRGRGRARGGFRGRGAPRGGAPAAPQQ
jgi:5'-3' exoribonuclease 1